MHHVVVIAWSVLALTAALDDLPSLSTDQQGELLDVFSELQSVGEEAKDAFDKVGTASSAGPEPPAQPTAFVQPPLQPTAFMQPPSPETAPAVSQFSQAGPRSMSDAFLAFDALTAPGAGSAPVPQMAAQPAARPPFESFMSAQPAGRPPFDSFVSMQPGGRPLLQSFAPAQPQVQPVAASFEQSLSRQAMRNLPLPQTSMVQLPPQPKLWQQSFGLGEGQSLFQRAPIMGKHSSSVFDIYEKGLHSHGARSAGQLFLASNGFPAPPTFQPAPPPSLSVVSSSSSVGGFSLDSARTPSFQQGAPVTSGNAAQDDILADLKAGSLAHTVAPPTEEVVLPPVPVQQPAPPEPRRPPTINANAVYQSDLRKFAEERRLKEERARSALAARSVDDFSERLHQEVTQLANSPPSAPNNHEQAQQDGANLLALYKSKLQADGNTEQPIRAPPGSIEATYESQMRKYAAQASQRLADPGNPAEVFKQQQQLLALASSGQTFENNARSGLPPSLTDEGVSRRVFETYRQKLQQSSEGQAPEQHGEVYEGYRRHLAALEAKSSE